MPSAYKELRDDGGNKLEINTQINKGITNYDKTDEGSTKLGLRNNDWGSVGVRKDSLSGSFCTSQPYWPL